MAQMVDFALDWPMGQGARTSLSSLPLMEVNFIGV